MLRYKDIVLSEETFSPNGLDVMAVPVIDGYKILSVSPWVKGDWSDKHALIKYHGYLGGYNVSCRNLDSDNSHKWIYGALVLYAKN